MLPAENIRCLKHSFVFPLLSLSLCVWGRGGSCVKPYTNIFHLLYLKNNLTLSQLNKNIY